MDLKGYNAFCLDEACMYFMRLEEEGRILVGEGRRTETTNKPSNDNEAYYAYLRENMR